MRFPVRAAAASSSGSTELTGMTQRAVGQALGLKDGSGLSEISDSKGPGGGAFLIKKCGAGTMQLSGRNTYTGQTILEGDALSISSLNNFVKGKPASSLGTPMDIEAG